MCLCRVHLSYLFLCVSHNVTKQGEQPEFYDDDIPLLLLGSATPPHLLGEDTDFLSENVIGLIQASGSPSAEHDNMLKRSARFAMALLKFLVLEFVEDGAEPGELNLFALSFCSFPVEKYGFLSLDLHIVGDERGGAKEDACQIMVLLLTKHTNEDQETAAPIAKEDLLHNPRSHQVFDSWCKKNATKEQKALMQKNEEARQAELLVIAEDEIEADDSDEDLDDDGGTMAELRRKRRADKKAVMNAGEIIKKRGPALRWEDSTLYKEQQARVATQKRMQRQEGEYHDTVRDKLQAAQDLANREEEKAKIMGKDPLGLKSENFDLKAINQAQIYNLEQGLMEFQEEIRKGEAGGEDNKVLRAKKESLELILDGIIGVSGDPGIKETGHSILPTDSKFDPILFLTLVHRNASYEELMGSMKNLSSKFRMV